MNVDEDETASFVHRLLKRAEFDTQTKRMGAVIHLSCKGLRVWRLHAERNQHWVRGAQVSLQPGRVLA